MANRTDIKTQYRDSVINQKFGNLTIESSTNKRYNKYIVYKCKCNCGKYTYATINVLRMNKKTSCGCQRHATSIDKIFHTWKVISIAKELTNNNKLYNAICLQCNKKTQAQVFQLKKKPCEHT